MNVLEAFTHLCLQNNYFAWLYDYKVSHQNSTLKTEYDSANEEPSDTEGLSEDNTNAPQIFCGNLDEVEIALLATTAGDFTLLFDNEDPAYKAAKEASEEVRKETLANTDDIGHI